MTRRKELVEKDRMHYGADARATSAVDSACPVVGSGIRASKIALATLPAEGKGTPTILPSRGAPECGTADRTRRPATAWIAYVRWDRGRGRCTERASLLMLITLLYSLPRWGRVDNRFATKVYAFGSSAHLFALGRFTTAWTIASTKRIKHSAGLSLVPAMR